MSLVEVDFSVLPEVRDTKRSRVSREIRQQIVLGDLVPGSRIPSRRDLVKKFSVSPVTAQQALEDLQTQGFIELRHGSGGYVRENSPHLCRYALAFPCPQGDPEFWSRFSTALLYEAGKLESRHPTIRVPVYYNVDRVFHSADRQETSSERRALEEEVRNHRLAGVILARTPFTMADSPITNDPIVPRVCISTEGKPNLPAVFVDYQSFSSQALDELKRRKRSRIAIISDFRASSFTTDLVTKGLADRGMTTHPWWIHKVASENIDSARSLIHLLMRGAPEDRPDGIVVTDDNLVEGVSAGLVAAGIRVPTDVDVIAHANFPLPTPTVLPVVSLGFSVTEILETCLRLLDAQRRGEKVPDLTLVPAVFANAAAQAGVSS